MKEITKSTNKIQFPKSSYSFENTGFFYISDIHLEQHIFTDNSKNITDDDIENKIKEIVKNIFGRSTNKVKRGEYDNDYILFCGDIGDNIEIIDLFFANFRKEYPNNKNIIYVLGNHELSAYNTVKECVQEYQIMANKYEIMLLQNQGFVVGKYGIPLFQIIGGIGFSKYNETYNANNMCYSNDLKNNRDNEIRECEKFLSFYYYALEKARKSKMPQIVITHCPTSDWLPNNSTDIDCVYFNGHNHHNSLIRTETKTFFADNQIGYTKPIKMKHCIIGHEYDPFAKYEDGFHIITTSDYQQFYRYVGEHINEPKMINKFLNIDNNKFYLIKRNGFYGFFIVGDKDTKICQGGVVKNISKIKDIKYFDDQFLRMINVFISAMKPYREIQEQISREVKSLGFEGSIHGCIIDLDFYHHIMLNPYDGKLLFYYSPTFGVVKQFDSFSNMLLSIKSPKSLSNSSNKLIELRNNDAIVTKSDKELKKYIDQFMRVDVRNSIYRESRKIQQLQRLFSSFLLRDWNDELIQKIILDDCEGKILLEDN